MNNSILQQCLKQPIICSILVYEKNGKIIKQQYNVPNIMIVLKENSGNM